MIASNGHPIPSQEAKPDPLRLLSSFLAHHCDPAAFAQAEGLSATDLLDWSANPAIQAHLTDLKRFVDQALALRTAQARIASLDTLESVARSSDDPIERRRAASSILRNTVPIRRTPRPAISLDIPAVTLSDFNSDADRTSPSRPYSPSPLPITDLDDAELPGESLARSAPAPRTTLGEPIPPLLAHAPVRFAPNPALTPDDLANTVALALYTHRDPACAAAIAAYLAPNATRANQPSSPSAPDLHALAPRAEPVHHQHFCTASSPDASTHTIVLMHARAASTHYCLRLTRSDSDPHPNCWLIAGLTRSGDTS